MLISVLSASCCSVPDCERSEALPEIYPDYVGVTVPVTIAPLDFKVEGAGKVVVEIVETGDTFSGGGGVIRFPVKKWRCILGGDYQFMTLVVKADIGGKWIEYAPFKIFVSQDPIDETVVYRRIDPGYELYAEMGIYQRNLSDFNERAVFENTKVSPGCVNCHSFAKCDPSSAQLHFRGEKGGTLIISGDEQNVFNMKNDVTLGTVYPYWHPDGRYIAYSVNDIRQSFHNVPDKVLEVYDLASDVVVFDTQENKLLVYPLLKDSTRLETFPAFSPDGRTLYFCSAAAKEDLLTLHYELCSIDFNPSDGTVGDTITTIWSDSLKSASFPRPSYDGRSLLFTVSSMGNFSIWHPEADLWMADLSTGECAPAQALNSPDTESYHSWSGNSKWVVFSSRRDDGRYTRVYFAHKNDDGTFSKPFMLPQKSPESNTLLLQSYNIPEFCNGRFEIDKRKVYSGERESAGVELRK